MTRPRLIAVALLALTALCWGEACAQKPVIFHRAVVAAVAPEITSHGSTAAVSVNENTTAVASLTFTPSEADLTLSGSDSALFEIASTGSGTATLSFIDEPDYETPADANTDNDYLVTVTATNDALTDATAFTVTVDDLNEDLAANSLRPNEVFGPIPGEAIAAGFFPNDLSTSVRTDVTPTTRTNTLNVAAGTYTAPISSTMANQTINIQGDVTFDGAGIIHAHSNVTTNLNGHTLTYNNVDVEGLQTGTVSSSTAGNGSGGTYPTLTPSGLTLTSNSHSLWVLEFTSGAESGNFYNVVSNTTTVLTLENLNRVSDDATDLRNWEDGGPAASDTFRIYEARNTYGVGANANTFPGGTQEVVNGFIVQGAGYGRGSNRAYNSGMSPVSYYNGGTPWLIGGVSATYHADDSSGINVTGSTGAVVKYCEVTDNGTLLTNRQRNSSAIQVGATGTIQHNLIHNHRQVFSASGNGSTIEYNEVYGDSLATNSTGIGTFSNNDVTIRFNNLYKVGQHPVCIGIAEETNRADIHGNWCESMVTRTSPEYGISLAVGFSNRWGTRTDANHAYENAFITYAHDDVYKSRTLLLGGYDVLVEELIEDNFIAAISDDGTDCYAAHPGVAKFIFRNNILMGSHTLWWMTDTYWPCPDFPRWINTTTIKHGSDPNFATFRCSDYTVQEVDYISGTYGAGTGTAASDITFEDGPDNIYPVLRFGWNLTATVTNGGNPVEGAIVTVKDKNANILRDDYVTDASGQVVVDVPAFYRIGPSFGSTTLAPLTVEAVDGAATGSNTISPTSDASISVGISE